MCLLGSVTFHLCLSISLGSSQRDSTKMVAAPHVGHVYSFGISSLCLKGEFVMHFIRTSGAGATCRWTLCFSPRGLYWSQYK